MANFRNSTFEAQATMSSAGSSYTDTTGAYMEYDATPDAGSTGGYAQFGAKASAGGSVGVKIRTLLAGAAMTVFSITPAGATTITPAPGAGPALKIYGVDRGVGLGKYLTQTFPDNPGLGTNGPIVINGAVSDPITQDILGDGQEYMLGIHSDLGATGGPAMLVLSDDDFFKGYSNGAQLAIRMRADGGITITQTAVNQPVILSTGHVTNGSDSTGMVNYIGTWNTTGTPTALSVAIANTASDPSSLLLNLSSGPLGTTPRFTVRIDGAVSGGLYNGQTISSAASLSGTLTVATGVTVSAGGVTVNAGLSTFQALQAVTGIFNGATSLASGSAVEVGFIPGHGFVQSFDRTGVAYQPLQIEASTIFLGKDNAAQIQWGQPLVALGGGATATLGTIGGSGPAAAAQNKWLRVLDSTGAACWAPVWK